MQRKEVEEFELLKLEEEESLLDTISSGPLKKIYRSFKMHHDSPDYSSESRFISYSLMLFEQEKAEAIAKTFLKLELKYHKGSRESTHACLKENFGTNENINFFVKLTKPPSFIKQLYLKYVPKAVFKFFDLTVISYARFFAMVSLKIYMYYADLYKDIFIIKEYANYFRFSESEFTTFGYQGSIL